MKVELYMVDTR